MHKVIHLVLIVLFFIFCSGRVIGQSIGIGSEVFVPHPSAGLDVNFSNKGVLFPRVYLQSFTDNVTVQTPATGLVLFNTNNALPSGLFVNIGSSDVPSWEKIATYNNERSDMWLLGGNRNVNPLTHFLGTLDNQDFTIRTNNIERMRILSNGFVGIGTTIPQQRLQVNNGNFFISNDNNQAGKILLQSRSGSGGFYTSFQASDQNEDIEYFLPSELKPTQKEAGMILQVNEYGVMSWLDMRSLKHYVIKPGDESVVNSTTLQPDDHLFVNLQESTFYLVEIFLAIDVSGGNQGIRVQVNVPANATGHFITEIFRDNAAPRIYNTAIGNSFPHGINVANIRVVRITGYVTTGSTPGTLSLSWAQWSASANATRVLQGSYLRITPFIH